tara:strand:+ start:15223 stop:16119 length:897 start_codon:yes stop_codon:yes gene_type:complete
MDDADELYELKNINNNKVTEKKVQYLKNIYQKCKWYYWLHTKTYYYMYKIYIGLHIPMITVNLITAIFNTNHSDNDTYNKTIKYCSAVILLLNTFFTSLLNLLKIDKKLEFHKNKATDYISLSNEIEEYIMIGDEIEPTIRLYKTYLSYSTDNEFVVPERIIKLAEKTLNKKYTNNIDNDINYAQIGKSSFTYIGELIREIKKENKTSQIDFNSDEHIKIKQLLTTKNDDIVKDTSKTLIEMDIEPDIIGKKSKKKKPNPDLNINTINSKSPLSRGDCSRYMAKNFVSSQSSQNSDTY